MIFDLIIPARNEQANIAAVLDALPPRLFRRVIVADNASTDQTAALAKAGGAVVVYESRPGYGGACQAALHWLDHQPDPPDAVAFLDADLADDPAQLPRLCQPVKSGEADLVIGCRPALAEPGALTFTQRFGNRLACTLMRLATGRRYRDMGPMRVICYRSLKQLQMADMTWGWTLEMQFKAAVTGLRIIEIDVPYRRRHAGESKISGTWIGSVRAGYRIIVTLIRLWWRYRKGPPRHAKNAGSDRQT